MLKSQNDLSEGTGCIIFWKDSEKLFISKASNLQKAMGSIINRSSNNEHLLKLISLTTRVEIIETENLFTALLLEKKDLSSLVLPNNQLIKPFYDYVYLSLDFFNPPFLKVHDNTLANAYFIGPFRDRFFLEDLINTMNDLFRYPACLSEKYPCDRLKTDSCDGYCLKPRKELHELFIRSYLQINPELNRQISERITHKNDELEFTGAEYLKRQSEILVFFYRTVKFLHIAKNLSGEFSLPQGKIILENGLISSYLNPHGETIDFPVFLIEYQEKEYLAVNKENLDEMWIVYHHLEKTQKKLFSRIYLKSVKDFICRMKDYEEF